MKIDPLISGEQYVEHNDWRIIHSPKLAVDWLHRLLTFEVPLTREENSDVIKSDNSSVIIKLESDIGYLAAKYYHKPNVTRVLNNSLACVSWYFAHRLRINGIQTPTPLALMEERKMGLYFRSWYICEFDDSINCKNYFIHTTAITPAMANVASAIVDMFVSLRECHLSHGNIKASNILISDGRPCLIGLDFMSFHPKKKKADLMWHRDIKQFMASWDERYDIYKHFKQAFLKRKITI